MKPLIMMIVVGQQTSYENATKASIHARADSFTQDTNRIALDVDLADAVLFPVGTKISVTIEALEA